MWESKPEQACGLSIFFVFGDNISVDFGNRPLRAFYLLISYQIALDQVDPEKGIASSQYICLMTASVNSSGTLL